MKQTATFLLLLFVSLPSLSLAQPKADDANPLVSSLKAIHDITADFVLATAEMLDEDMYEYRPTVQVRTTRE